LNLDRVFESSNPYKQLINKYVIASSTNTEGIITFVTDAFCNISGYSRDELVGSSHNILKNENENKKTYKELWRTISSGNIWIGKIYNQDKNNKEYLIDTTITPNYSEVNSIIGYTSVIKNITYNELVKKM
jgi:PAS domain S-box-containing protein